jgi:G protein beta subunit-like protein
MSGRDDTGEQVILATAGYDHSIRFWQAHNGVCHRTVPHTDSISFSI